MALSRNRTRGVNIPTSFVIPALFDSLVQHQGLSPHKAWRVAYVVPFAIIVVVALGMALTCEDTPTGKWSERLLFARENLMDDVAKDSEAAVPSPISKSTSPQSENGDSRHQELVDTETQRGEYTSLAEVRGEIVIAPTIRETFDIVFSKHSLALAGPYACSFGRVSLSVISYIAHVLPRREKINRHLPPGSEIAINSILGSYYFRNFPALGQTGSGNWAAMLGLLNFALRPLGGIVADLIYRRTHSVWAKKHWLTFAGMACGVFLLAIGLFNPQSKATMFGLVAAYAFFMEAANGANFAVVPHVHPFANGTGSDH
jgi:NNP family nitrate/nitrite transporter-like MFS transporter